MGPKWSYLKDEKMSGSNFRKALNRFLTKISFSGKIAYNEESSRVLKPEREVNSTTDSGGEALGRNPAIRRGEERGGDDGDDDDFNDSRKTSVVP